MFLAHDLPVEFVALALLFLENRVAPIFKRRKTLIKPPCDTAIKPKRRPRQIGQEAAIMADQDERGFERCEFGFKPLDRGQIEMVRRLIQHQHVGFGRENTRQSGAARLSA